MFCPNCGKQLSDGAQFCGGCGSRLTDTPEQTSFGQPQYRQPYQQQYGQPYQQQPYVNQYVQQQPYYNRYQQQQMPKNSTTPAGSPMYVGFADAVRLYFLNAFNFDGRSTRSEYWWAVLFNLMVAIVVGLIGHAMESLIPSMLLTIVFFVPGFSALVRRLHDIGRDATPAIVFYSLTGVGLLIGYISTMILSGINSTSDISVAFGGLAASFGGLILLFLIDIAIIILGIYMIVLACTESQNFPNKYGRAPVQAFTRR